MANFRLFGFSFEVKPSAKIPVSPSFTPQQNDQGAITVSSGVEGYPGGASGSVAWGLDFDGTALYSDLVALINRYREMALVPEVEDAINDIVNEAIIKDDDDPPLTLLLDSMPAEYDDDEFKVAVHKEFQTVIDLLDFNDNAYELFRQWYVDGRIFFHLMIDKDHPKDGILELRMVDPRCIVPIREVMRSIDANTSVPVVQVVDEYFQYNEMGWRGMPTTAMGTRIAKDSIVYVHSGQYNPGHTVVLSYLHKASKVVNQLRMIEDASVIYRLSRAPERRIFYIDVGNLPKAKAEQYVTDLMYKHKNKMTYDVTSGETRDDRRVMSMMEDYWLPRREGGKGTEISTLPGGQNLGQIEDIQYFKTKLYRALNVPITRTEPGQGNVLGRATEITRDEIKFSRFLGRLRSRFTELFDSLMGRQLVLKGIIPNEEVWRYIRKTVNYEWAKDSYFSELKSIEIEKERLNLVGQIDPYQAKYFSHRYVQTKILHQSEEEIEEITEQIADEKSDPRFAPPAPEFGGGGGDNPFGGGGGDDPNDPNDFIGNQASRPGEETMSDLAGDEDRNREDSRGNDGAVTITVDRNGSPDVDDPRKNKKK